MSMHFFFKKKKGTSMLSSALKLKNVGQTHNVIKGTIKHK